MTSVPLTRDEQLPADWRDLLALTKPRVMSLVVFTGLCGLLAAPGPVHPVLGFTAVLCIALGAGAAGAVTGYGRRMSEMGGKRSFRVRQPSTLRNPGYRQEEERGQHDQADPGEPDIQEGQWYGCGIDRHGGPNPSEHPAME